MDIAAIPVTALRGIGPKLARRLARLGLRSVQDMLFHLPFRYQDRTRLTPIGSLVAGQEALVTGVIELADVSYKGRRALLCRVSDGTGLLTLRFFHFSAAQQTHLQRGQRLRAFGEARLGPAGIEMVHPEYSVLTNEADPEPEPYLTPIYPTTDGVHQVVVRRLVQQALEQYLAGVEEWLPMAMLAERGLPT